jgi:hypothetical protein
LPRPLDLKLPVARRRSLLALAISVGLHALLFMFGAIEARLPRLPLPVLPKSSTPVADTVPLAFLTPTPPVRRLPAPTRTPRQPVRKPVETPFSTPVPEPIIQPKAPPVDTGATPGPKEPAPLPPTAVAPSELGRIGPELAGGRLWVRPLPLPPRELAQRLSKGHVALVDSAVTQIVQSFLDSIANEPASDGATLPDWTTQIAGKRFGVDSKNIYIAGLKIPAAVLALLPISGGNLDRNQAYNRMMDLRADIQQAARRADNLAEFKERIREIRLRKEREEEFERRRREGASGVSDRDSAQVKPAPRDDRDASGARQQQ